MYEVRLPSDALPIFPDRCHRCGADTPDAVRMLPTARQLPILHILIPLPIPLGRSRFRAVPHCRECLRKERTQLVLQFVFGFPWFLGSMFASIAMAKSITTSQLWLLLATVFTFTLATPVWVWAAWKMPAVQVTTDRDTSAWTFVSPWVASRFARANNTTYQRKFDA